jgi:hypothetical protein
VNALHILSLAALSRTDARQPLGWLFLARQPKMPYGHSNSQRLDLILFLAAA